MTTTTDVKEKSYDSNHDTTTRSTKHRQSYLYVLILTVTTIALSFQVERSYIQGINAARQASKQEAGNCGNANRTGLSISFEDDKKSKSLNHTRSPPNLTDELLDRFIVVPEYKMVFCYSEKVGCTMFNKLFRDLRMLYPKINRTEAKWLSTLVWFRNTPEHHNLNKKDMESILANPEWTKAVFYRDPIDRFVSAFQSKCGGFDPDGEEHCTDSFGHPNSTFSDALHHIKTANTIQNPHFAPMSEFCGGLSNSLQYYDMVQELKRDTVGDHVRQLLQKVGVPADTIELLIENVVKTGGARRMPAIDEKTQQLWSLPAKGGAPPGHNTHDNQNLTKQHLNQAHMDSSFLERFYSSDYELFQQPTNACVD